MDSSTSMSGCPKEGILNPRPTSETLPKAAFTEFDVSSPLEGILAMTPEKTLRLTFAAAVAADLDLLAATAAAAPPLVAAAAAAAPPLLAAATATAPPLLATATAAAPPLLATATAAALPLLAAAAATAPPLLAAAAAAAAADLLLLAAAAAADLDFCTHDDARDGWSPSVPPPSESTATFRSLESGFFSAPVLAPSAALLANPRIPIMELLNI
mmetsp:Transcript_9101/g.14109  ORF Transcript_9101/g.14109 Transcript_9101/m.14109 type:complete len:214 (+) Transcript_9101:172-813(+)